jgi:hypothetical protein
VSKVCGRSSGRGRLLPEARGRGPRDCADGPSAPWRVGPARGRESPPRCGRRMRTEAERNVPEAFGRTDDEAATKVSPSGRQEVPNPNVLRFHRSAEGSMVSGYDCGSS